MMHDHKKGIMIAVEGLDLSGKTAICNFLFNIAEFPSNQMVLNSERQNLLGKIARKLRDKQSLPRIVIELLFIASHVYDSLRIRIWLCRKRIVIQDRYYASLVAYYSTIPRAIHTTRLSLLPLLHFLKPVFPGAEITIYCKSSLERLRRRYLNLRTKHMLDEIMYSGRYGNVADKYRENLESLLPRSTYVIENENTLEELQGKVQDLVPEILRRLKQKR